MKSVIKIIILFWFFYWPSSVVADSFVGAEKDVISMSMMPPTNVDLVKQGQVLKDRQNLKDIEKVFTKVVQSGDEQMEKEADNLLKDKNKLDNFLSTLASRLSVQESKDLAGKVMPQSLRVRELLEDQYEDAELQKKKISLNFKKVNIKEAVNLICKMTGMKFIVDSDVNTFVSNINLKDMNISSALKIILNSCNPRLALLKDSNVWRIVRLPVAIEQLNFVVQDQQEKDILSVSTTMHNLKLDDALKARLEKLWQGIAGGEKGKTQGQYLIFDENSHKIFYRSSSKNVETFGTILKELDVKIPQVRIEARVIVADKDFDERLGLQSAGIYNRSASAKHFDLIGSGPVNSGKNGPLDPTTANPLMWAMNFLPSLSSLVTQPGVFSIPFVFGNKDLTTKRLNLTLAAAENKKEIKTILKPCLLVNNEEVAEILSGQQMPQQVKVQEASQGQELSNLSTTSYKDVGMKIRVKPVVGADQESVFLDIYVENSSIAQTDVPVATTSAEINNSFTYKISTASSKNRVLLKSGQTTLIGGLITSSQENVKTGVPFLQDIPVIGWLFKGTAKRIVDRQLLIFITPTLV